MQADFLVFVAWTDAHTPPELHMAVSRQILKKLFLAWTDAHTPPELHMAISRQILKKCL
jgi:hypothetical protein